MKKAADLIKFQTSGRGLSKHKNIYKTPASCLSSRAISSSYAIRESRVAILVDNHVRISNQLSVSRINCASSCLRIGNLQKHIQACYASRWCPPCPKLRPSPLHMLGKSSVGLFTVRLPRRITPTCSALEFLDQSMQMVSSVQTV